jgi:hypothetical protein
MWHESYITIGIFELRTITDKNGVTVKIYLDESDV